MEASKACFELVKTFEGCKLTGYLDPVGVPTIGYGHTAPSVRPGDKITQAQADAYLLQDIQRAAAGVDKAVTHPLTQAQFDACTSFAYNVGVSRFERSTMLTLINGGNLSTAANEFTKWNKAGGKVLQGLVRRRNAERALFLGEK